VQQHTSYLVGNVIGFVANFMFFPVVKEFLKSVKTTQSYRQSSAAPFSETQYLQGLTNSRQQPLNIDQKQSFKGQVTIMGGVRAARSLQWRCFIDH